MKYAHYNGVFWDTSVVEYEGLNNRWTWPPSLKFDKHNKPHIVFTRDMQMCVLYCYKDSIWYVSWFEPNTVSEPNYDVDIQFCKKSGIMHALYTRYSISNLPLVCHAWGEVVTKINENKKSGIKDARNGFNIYPNISSGLLNVEWTQEFQGGIELAIYDVCGKRIKSMLERDCLIGDHKKTLNISDLACGVYFMVLKQNNEAVSKKFTIVR
jgi:hypothetical protein